MAAMVLLDLDASSPALARAARTPDDAPLELLDSFRERFQGHFDNEAQVRANDAAGLAPRQGGGHEHIHCVLREVSLAKQSSHGSANQAHVLASYYFNGQPEAIFRERLYALETLPCDEQFGRCVRMSIYKLRVSTTERLRAEGGVGSADVSFFSAEDVADSLRVRDADVFWRRIGDRFEGHMRTESIDVVSERSGQLLRVRDDVALWDNSLWVNDRGSDVETGEYVYGNIHGVPYKMQRVPDDHWTAHSR